MLLVHTLLKLAGKYLGKGRLSILIYHQVFAQQDVMRPSEPTAEMFEWQMNLLRQYYTPLSLTAALQALKENKLPENAVCVTFDDGYENNLTIAQPILAKYQIPATVYVATGFSKGQNMFNDRVLDLLGDVSYNQFDLSAVSLGTCLVSSQAERIALAHQVIAALKYLNYRERSDKVDQIYQANNAGEYPARMMTHEQIKVLANSGVEIGAHTHDHPILKTLSTQDQQQQLRQSKVELEELLSKPVKHFAYPNGKLDDDYSVTTVDLVAELGFESAVSTHWGVSGETSDVFQLKRFTPWDISPLRFDTRLRLNQIRGAL